MAVLARFRAKKKFARIIFQQTFCFVIRITFSDYNAATVSTATVSTATVSTTTTSVESTAGASSAALGAHDAKAKATTQNKNTFFIFFNLLKFNLLILLFKIAAKLHHFFIVH
jgi:hypothetical protein